jgi:hypothetical protein
MDLVRVLDRSHKAIKDYWHLSDILKGFNNINTAWEVVSVKCSKGVWGKLLPQFMHDITGFEPVDNTVDDVSRLAQKAGLDEVRAEDITQLFDSHGQQLSNEDLEDMVKELSQQKEVEKEKEEEPPLKCMKTSDLQHSVSAMENLSDELCDTGYNWEQNVKVKGV